MVQISKNLPDSVEPVAVSIPEAARMLGICTKNAYALAATEGFPVVRVGKRLIVPVDGLRNWVNNQSAVC